jgi:hypothetical protein
MIFSPLDKTCSVASRMFRNDGSFVKPSVAAYAVPVNIAKAAADARAAAGL